MSSPLEIKVSPRAQAQIEEAAKWWAENRQSAPGAIRQEVARILTLLSTQPAIGVPARRARKPGLRRIHLSRVRYYIYYRVSAEALEVLAFWHTTVEAVSRNFELRAANSALAATFGEL